MGEWIKRGYSCIKFLPRKGKVQKGFKKSSHTHKVGHKRDHFKSLHHLVNRTNWENFRCHYTRFTVRSSHKALVPISNEALLFR
ncbi:hypothetical protein H5410_031080 [Solanum commersonii]|uniref:Uncharacterized protein n=1 Tax=Solanum commersonii TaxID=4109 RepID=A0A9J5YL89_SOLCO|nr:hypothetical protein H5410_031080 [Solanum commersonii]